MTTMTATVTPLAKSAGGKVQLKNAVLEEKNGEIIAKGWLALKDINLLLVDQSYQREFLTGGQNRKRILDAIAAGKRLPTVLVGMRGCKFHSKPNVENGEDFFLENPCYIVDGFQRVGNVQVYAEEHPESTLEFGVDAEIKFNTTVDTEREDFRILNLFRTPVSSNVLLRNERHCNKAVDTLMSITESRRSVLFERVSWDQNMTRGMLFTGGIIAQTAMALHTGINHRGNTRALALTIDGVCSKASVPTFRENVIYFFDLLNECFHFGNIAFRQKATVIKGNFMTALAMVLARNENFWHGRDLVVTKDQRRRLARFPVQDLEIQRLSGGGPATVPILYDLLVQCMNKQVRTENRLRLKAKFKD